MANLQTVLEVVFNGIDNASDVARHVADSFGEIDSAAQDIGAPLADLANSLLATEAKALRAGAALIGVAIDAADAFNTGFSEITTLIDQPVEGLQDFRKEILAYAATSTQSLDQVTAATYNAISQGVDYTKSLEAVSVAEKLAVAGKADLNVTLQALIGTLNAYGTGMQDAGRYSDVFFQTVKLGKTTIPELAASISGVTSTASLGGVSIETLGAAIATLTAAGAGTSESVTRINAALTAIIKPSGEAAKLASELGLEFDVNALKSKGFAAVLQDVAVKTGGSADKMAILFGSTEALNAVNVLAITSSGKFRDNLDAMTKAAGATDAAFAKMADATSTLAQALKVAFVSFGTPLLASFKDAEDALASLAVAFIKVSESGGFKPLQDVVNDAFGGIADTVESVAKNLPDAFENIDWTGLISSLEELGSTVGDLLKAFFGEIDITTVDGLRSAIQTVINSFETLTRIVSGIIKEFEPFFAAIGETVRHFNELDNASKLEFGQALGAIKAVVDAGTGLGLALIAIGRAGIEMGDVLDVVFGAVKVAVNSIQVSFDLLALGITKVLQTALRAAIAVDAVNPFSDSKDLDDAKAKLADLDRAAAAITSNMERNAQELRDGWNQATGEASEKSDQLRASLSSAEEGLRNTGQAGKDGAAGIDEIADSAYELQKIDIKPIEALETLPEDADRAWTALQALIPAGNQLKGTFSVVGNSATEAAQKTKDAKTQLDALTNSGKLSVDQLLELTKTTNDFKVKMEEIASNERIKNIEFAVQLKTAQLEADVERVKATFSSIDTTISSTGDLLGGLFDNLAGTSNVYDKLDIKSQIDLENKRRQEALDVQKKLAEAEIERIEAQTRALNRGDALIQIDGTGLAPELEAFMWRIVEAIRVRANAEFADFLLASGVPA